MITQEFLDRFRTANLARKQDAAGDSVCSDWTPEDWVGCLLGELGEMANFDKKISRSDSGWPTEERDLDRYFRARAFELADCFTYLDLIAIETGVKLRAPMSDGVMAIKQRWLGVPTLRAHIDIARELSRVATSRTSGSSLGEHLQTILCQLVTLSEIWGEDFESLAADKFNEVSKRMGSEIKL